MTPRFSGLVALWIAVACLGNGGYVVDGFSAMSSPLFGQQNTASSSMFRVSPETAFLQHDAHSSRLQVKENSDNGSSLFRKSFSSRVVGKRITWLKKKFRRSMAVLFTISLCWFGGSQLHSSPCHAVSPPQPTGTVRLASVGLSASLDQMVDRYVKDHMFDEDAFDPAESVFRETHDDLTTGEYPQVLKQITTGALGKGVVSRGKPKVTGRGLVGLLKGPSKFLQRFGMSEPVSLVVSLVASLFTIFALFVNIMISYSNIQKRGLDKINRERYGENYSVSAIERVEEDVEAPDDDEDEDDDEEDVDEDEE